MAINSYDFTNTVRNVDEAFEVLIQDPYQLLSLFERTGGVENRKYEWINDTLTQVKTTITSFDTDGDGTGINVASTAGIVAGSILRFQTSGKVSRTEKVKVASVDSATDLTVVRDYGGTAGETFVVGDIVTLVSSPKNEGSQAGSGTKHEGVMEYNYTEIFDEIAEVTRTSNQTRSYDKYTQLPSQERVALESLRRKIANAVIHGIRVERTSGENGSMGGLIQYIATGGNTASVGGAISETVLNNSFESILAKGGASSSALAMVLSSNQAQRISNLTPNQSAVIQRSDVDDQKLGNYVSRFISNLPVMGGLSAKIMIDYNMPSDQILLLDTSRIKLKTMEPVTAKDAALPGEDGYKTRFLTEMTLEIKNAAQAHYLLTGLTI